MVTDMETFVTQYATVILLVLFVGILIWAFRPKNRKRFERHADIPLRDDEDRPT